MLSPTSIFRVLIAATFIGAIASVFASTFPGNISDEWRGLLERNGEGGVYGHLDSETYIAATLAISLLVLGMCLSITVGLFFFWRPARLANVVLTILFLAIGPWSGLVVLLPFEAALYDFSMLCEGAVLALSYSSPIRDYFECRVGKGAKRNL